MRALRTAWPLPVLLVLSCAGLGTPRVPDTPEGTVRFVAQGLADSRPQVVWQALPPSWQSDVTALLHESAEVTDPELYGLGWTLAGKLARILDEKPAFILDHPMFAGRLKDREKTEALLHAAAGLLKTLAGSELADREALRTLDVEKFLAGTGQELLHQAGELGTLLQGMQADLPRTPAGAWRLDGLRLQDVAVLHQEGTRARLRLTLAGGAATEQDWVQVEGRWVPNEMADAWPKALVAARQRLASAVPSAPEQKQALLVQLRMVDGALDAILATRTPGEFQAALGWAFGTMLGAAVSRAPAQVAPSPAPSFAPHLPPPAVALGPAPPSAPPGADTLLHAHPIAVREARRHIGASVHVVAMDGVEFDGTLRGADSRTLVLERESPAGTMTHAMAVEDVRTLQIWR